MAKPVDARKLFTPFERKVLMLAWEGRYATWELVDWFLPMSHPKMTLARRRELAEGTLRKFVKRGLIFVQRFHFIREKWENVPAEKADAVLSADRYWAPTDVDSWQLRFLTTEEGNRVCPGPPQTKDGWMSMTWWLPKKERLTQARTKAWTLGHLRRYIDRRQTVYEFYRPIPAILDFYRKHPDDPLDRMPYFWNQVGGYCWFTIRWGSGDQERAFRSYVGLWLMALKFTSAEWRETVRIKKRPLEAVSNDWGFGEVEEPAEDEETEESDSS